MLFRRTTLVLFACLCASGCRKDPYVDAYFEMLNNEKRQLEDRIYELEYDYEKALRELESQRPKSKSPAASKSSTRKSPKEKVKEPEVLEEAESPGEPTVEFPKGFSAPDNKQSALPPELLPPANHTPGRVLLASAAKPAEGEAEDPDSGPSLDRETATEDAPAVPDDQRVDYIYLNPRQTGGQDFDRQPGDDGLSVLIEPRNRDGQFVPRPAKVSIVVLDPAQSGAAARVARWDFDKDVAARVLRNSPLDRGLHFRFPWPAAPPEHERLQLFVRYWCEDGRKLEAERLISVRLPSSEPPAWTRRLGRTESGGSAVSGRPAPIQPQPVAAAPVEAKPVSVSVREPASPSQPASTAERPGRYWKPYR